MIILFPYWTGRLKYHDGLCWNIALITAIQVPIQDFWEEAGAGRCKQGNTEGGARLSLSSKAQWWTATGHCMHSKSAYLLLPRSRKKGMQQRPSKLQSSGCYHGVSFHISPLCDEVCSYSHSLALWLQRKYLASLIHLRVCHLNNYEHLSFISSAVSLATCKDTPEKVVSGKIFSLGSHGAF